MRLDDANGVTAVCSWSTIKLPEGREAPRIHHSSHVSINYEANLRKLLKSPEQKMQIRSVSNNRFGVNKLSCKA